MNLDAYFQVLRSSPDKISFDDTISVIDTHYHFKETAFSNGEIVNNKGENSGSCKIFAFDHLSGLTENQVLQCFGDFYRKDVLENPFEDTHQNIRNFMQYGWIGVKFEAEALMLK